MKFRRMHLRTNRTSYVRFHYRATHYMQELRQPSYISLSKAICHAVMT